MINGSKLLPTGIRSLVESVTVDANADGADELVIVAKAYNPTGTPGARWALVGSTLLAPGNVVIVYAGYLDGADLPIALQRFRLVGEDVDYAAGDVPKVTIRGYSAAARLAEHTEGRAWEGPIADSAIVEEIAAEHGLEVDVEATTARTAGRVKKRGVSDLVFLRQLAVANGYGPPLVRYDEALDADVLRFRVQTVDAAPLVFTADPVEAEADLASGNLLRFRAALDLHGVPTSVLVTGFDPVLQVPVVITMGVAAAGQDPVILTGATATSYGIKGAAEFQARALADSDDPRDELIETLALPSTVLTVEDAVAWATRWIRLRASAFLTGEATILGHPSVWVGQVHSFAGLAPTHSGLWEVLACRHTFTAAGYTTSMDLGRILEDAGEPEEV
jgi:phage protein D